jgi:hypothetical protein
VPGPITTQDLNYMINTPITGHIYHVIDKKTNRVVKVGSTIASLDRRFNSKYKRKYADHFLKEAYHIESSESDWYEKGNPFCPFLWHLVASEHLEIVRQNTFDVDSFSNKVSPLTQKYSGFDGSIWGKIGGKIGGKISGKERVESGVLARCRTPEHQAQAGKISGLLSVKNKTGIHSPDFDRVSASRKGGLKNVESGHLKSISSAGGKVSGLTQGRKNAENKTGFCGRSVEKMASQGQKLGLVHGQRAMHIRWHVNRGLTSPNCAHCAKSS